MTNQFTLALGKVTVNFVQGKTWTIDDLPPRSIALDGAVQGPHIDLSSQRFSFDHHAGCIRHVTLATCEQVRDALLVGFNPDQFTVWVNDVDADTVLSVWLLQNADELFGPRKQELLQLIQQIGRIDALGPAYSGHNGAHPLHTHLNVFGPEARSQCAETLTKRLKIVDEYIATGIVPLAKPFTQAGTYVAIDRKGQIVYGETAVGFSEIYSRGNVAAVLHSPSKNGSTLATIGKQSEFVRGDMTALFAELNEAENTPTTPWGGGSTIGGSPRHTDGSHSRLGVETIEALFIKHFRQ